MEIDINNYESVLIDYFDGKLNALEVAEVLLFLEQHPEIKAEFEAFGTLPAVEKIGIEEEFKTKLKKLSGHDLLAEKSFNELIIAQMEGDCSEKESLIIDELIAGHTSLSKLKSTFKLTKLVPDLTLTFKNKQSLKRKEAVVFYLNKRFAAAAALLLLASMVFLIYRNSSKSIDKVEIAQTKNTHHEIASPKNMEGQNTPLKEEVIAKELPSTKHIVQVTKENKRNKQQPTPLFTNS